MCVSLFTHIPLFLSHALFLSLSLLLLNAEIVGEIGNYDSVNCRLLRHKLKFIL